ncbi:hypothetical protein CORC01_03259 [Colletotrichum orchidophilum]|uniref:Uncharacterized protein n=1 Tax=Colletotrichum orchidophilum TaxID=1209926 RepID=A0A1G4BJM7_9PEZI|nr:uncharacterized protein CORC01_03259 [Colletotrichum orchidophilum]OHF01503.1 hypothetical protein CORC01_03259 [Colletotrichum orchidophilum]
MASRYPMPNVYAKQKTDAPSPSLISTAVKSVFSAPRSYPSTPASTSRYPLPTAYTQRDGADNKYNKRPVREERMGVGSRVSVASRDTIEKIKDDQVYGLGR